MELFILDGNGEGTRDLLTSEINDQILMYQMKQKALRVRKEQPKMSE